MCTINENHDIWFLLMCGRQKFLSFWAIICPFSPDNLENQNFKIEKNTWRCYHFTHSHHKWQSYDVWFLRYEVWQTEFLSFWIVFCPFTHLATQKIKIFKNWKKRPWEIIILQKCTKNHDHMLYCSVDMACNGCNYYFSFWAIFCPLPTSQPKKSKF